MPSNHPDSPAPLMGDKGNLSEGGIRVPFIIRGPGIEANSWSSVPIVGFDFFPTFAELARGRPRRPACRSRRRQLRCGS